MERSNIPYEEVELGNLFYVYNPALLPVKVMVYYPKHSQVDLGYYDQFFASQYFIQKLSGIIDSSHILNLKIPHPPLFEQRIIGTILASIDQTIEDSFQLTQRTQQLKQHISPFHITSNEMEKLFHLYQEESEDLFQQNVQQMQILRTHISEDLLLGKIRVP